MLLFILLYGFNLNIADYIGIPITFFVFCEVVEISLGNSVDLAHYMNC